MTAIEPQYLKEFRNGTTCFINLTVTNLIRQLYQMHGRVMPQKLQDQEEKICQMVYNSLKPIDGIFTVINELVSALF